MVTQTKPLDAILYSLLGFLWKYIEFHVQSLVKFYFPIEIRYIAVVPQHRKKNGPIENDILRSNAVSNGYMPILLLFQ